MWDFVLPLLRKKSELACVWRVFLSDVILEV
jgi:hypothetical protein